MTKQRRHSKSQLFNRRRREALVPASQPSGLELPRFQSLIGKHSDKQSECKPKEPLLDDFDKHEDAMDDRLRANAITVNLTPKFLEDAGIDDPEQLIPSDARYYYNELLPALLATHEQLLNTGVFQYRLGDRPSQGGMSTTYFLRRADAISEEVEQRETNGGPDIQYALDEDGLVTNQGESDLVLRCQWLPRRGDHHKRAMALRELVILEAQGKLRSAQLIKFDGSSAFRDVELALVTMKRASGKALTSLLPERFMPNDRVRPELSIKDMYALMQATRAWVQQLKIMYERKIQHRDIKPDHLFVNFDDPTNSDIIDWGIAKSMKSDRTATPIGVVVGSLQFLSPRAMRDAPDPDRDLFALGTSVGLALRLFFLKASSQSGDLYYNIGWGEAYDTPQLNGDSYHEQLKPWSPCSPERVFAYILSLMITPHDRPGSFHGDFGKLLMMIDAVLVDQRLWVEASDALQDLESLKQHGLPPDDQQRLQTQKSTLEHEMLNGTAETMRTALSAYRQLVTRIQQ